MKCAFDFVCLIIYLPGVFMILKCSKDETIWLTLFFFGRGCQKQKKYNYNIFPKKRDIKEKQYSVNTVFS